MAAFLKVPKFRQVKMVFRKWKKYIFKLAIQDNKIYEEPLY